MAAVLMTLVMAECIDSGTPAQTESKSAPVAEVAWLPATGHLFDGVEVYKGDDHTDIGLIAGGTRAIGIPRNDGTVGYTLRPVLVVYKSDSSRHWMDSNDFSKGWFVRSSDPRINSGQLTPLEDTVDVHHIRMDMFGCQSVKTFNSIATKLRQRNPDEEAFKTLLAIGISSGDCEMFQNGDSVDVTDTDTFPGYDRIHRPNEDISYWMFAKAVGP